MPNVLSIFSGGGGIDCGFKKAGFDNVVLCICYHGFSPKAIMDSSFRLLPFVAAVFLIICRMAKKSLYL